MAISDGTAAINPALEVVRGCAKALNVPVIELLGSEDNTNGRKSRGTGPTGKMRCLFEAASQLPRSQQEKLTAVLEAFVNQHAARWKLGGKAASRRSSGINTKTKTLHSQNSDADLVTAPTKTQKLHNVAAQIL
jgi:hypothetical protein